MSESIFEAAGHDSYVPTEAALGPWTDQALHGGPPTMLMAREIERFRSDARPRDAADVDARRSELAAMRRRVEQALERARPVSILIEEVPFGLTPADNEHAEQAIGRTRRLISTLALAVDFESHHAFELRKDFGVDMEAKPQVRPQHVVAAASPEPQARREFGCRGEAGQQHKQEHDDLNHSGSVA